MGEPVAWAGIWILVGVGLGRVWQILRHAKDERSLGALLAMLAKMASSDSMRPTAIRELNALATALESKETK